MPRDVTRSRSQLGGGGKTAPKVKDTDVQRALSEVYKELNVLTKSVSSVANLSQSTPAEGKDGDIRLYVDYAADGTKGYFVQGKFGDSWASGRLSFDSIDPKQQKSVVNRAGSYDADGGGYITTEGVTYENLDNNSDVGPLGGQVAKGNHNHEHQSLNGAGTNDHNTIDSHLSNLTKHRLASDDNSKYINTVSSTSNDSGDDDTWARSDHSHTLNQGETYTFTAKQNIDRGNATYDALYVRGTSDFVGDVSIDGNLTVDFAENAGGNTTIDQNLDVAGNVTAGQNVALNDKSSELSNNVNDTSTTTIHGKSFLKNSLEVLKALGTGEKHLTLASDSSNKLDISVTGTGVVNFSGNNAFRFDQSLEPEVTMTKNLGSQSKKWLSIHAGELIVENLVAQDVMATIGGRIIVAPTTKLMLAITSGESFITTEHDIFEINDIAYLQSAPSGVAQVEAMRIISTSGGSGPYAYGVTRNVDTSGANAWEKDDAIVNLGHEQGDGFIDLTATQSVYSNEGPMIGLFARPSETNGVLSDWNVPEIARLGNLSGTGYTGNDDFGIMIGENLGYSHIHGTYPFRGLIGNREGVKLYNSDISLYDGDDLTAFIGKDTNNRPVFALGNDMGSDFSDSSLLYKWDQTLNGGNGKYKLTLSNTDVDLGVDIALSENSIIDAMPWFTADPGGLGDDTEGLYLSNKWLGFYENPAGNGGNDTYWPIIIGSTGTGANLEPFFEIKNAATYPTEYIRYTVANGLEIAGKVNILGQQPSQVLKVNPDIQFNVSNNGAGFTETFTLTVTGKVFAHFRVKDASNGKIQFTNSANADVVTYTDILTNLSGVGSIWYTAELELTGSNGIRGFRWRNVGTDNTPHIVEDIVITRDTPGDPHAILYSSNAIPGNTDYTLSNDITLGNGSIEVGNAAINTGIYSTGKNGFTSTTPGFYLGTHNSDLTKFALNIGDSNTFLKYNNFSNELDINGANILISNASGVVNIGEDLADAGPVNSVLVGKWGTQTIDTLQPATTVAGGHGILVNHENSKDYTTLNENGFVRRGFDYPIIIHSGFHWGGPVNTGGSTSGTNTFNSSYFDYNNHGQYGGGNSGLGFASRENRISYFWNYDNTYVPTGRQLIWTFTPTISKGGSGAGESISDNEVRAYRFWGSGNDADSYWGGDGGGSEFSYNFALMHYESSNDAGMNSHSYTQGNMGTRGWGVDGSAYAYNGQFIPSYLAGSSGKAVSYGIIPSGTNVTYLYLIAGVSGTRSELGHESHCHGGILTIWETDE